jgi:alpha-D-ribose 1-methylphosphonate 5-triphosphate diphosphatase
MTAFTLHPRRILTGTDVVEDGCLTVEDGVIAGIADVPPAGAEVVELPDCDLLPGLIDLHSDCWNQRSQPRPTMTFPLADSLVALDTEVVAWGITTHFTCVAVQDDAAKLRSIARATEQVRVLEKLREELRADHRVHLRVEATTERIDAADQLAASPVVALLSYMDHTPGQGQYASEEDWRTYHAAIVDGDPDEMLRHLRARQEFVDDSRLTLARIAATHGLALASHDDDSTASVERAQALGASICEFPVTAEAAHAATERGIFTVMGAPNALRGQSHLEGNLSARRALAAGHLGALVSDYHPPALLSALYALADAGLCPLDQAVRLATVHPAQAAGLTDRGSLAPGKRADLVAVRRRGGVPAVAQTWVAGRPAFGGRA